MFKWLAQRRERQQRSRYKAGYDYALGALLRGEQTEGQIEVQADCQFDFNEFDAGILQALRDLRTKYIERNDSSEIQRQASLLNAQRRWIDEGARPGTFLPTLKYRQSFLDTALSSGATLTGKPDGSEAVTVVFSIDAWRAFDLATAPERIS